MEKIQVLIVWQNPLFRETLQAVLTAAHIPTSTHPQGNALDWPAGTERPTAIVLEGNRETGCALLAQWPAEEPIRLVTFNMDDDQACLLDYRPQQKLTKEALLQLLRPTNRPSARSNSF